jgi:hypothetical protein
MIIQLTATIRCQGKYFLRQHHYESIGVVSMIMENVEPRPYNYGKMVSHYIVEEEEVQYFIPADFVVELEKRMDVENRRDAFVEEMSDNTKDIVKAWEDVSGIRIKDCSGPDIDLTEYNKIKDQIKPQKGA